MSAQIVGFQDIIGLANQYGPSEVGNNGAAPSAAPALPQGTLLAKNLPKSMVGIPLTVVEPGATQSISIDVQREFRPDRLMLVDILGELTTPAFRDAQHVLTFSIGDTNLNASPNPVPMGVFAENAVGTSIRAPRTTDPSLGIDMLVENTIAAGEGAPTWGLAGAVFGPSARPGSGTGSTVSGIVGAAADDAGDPAAASSDDARNLPQSFIGIPYTAAPTLAGTRVSAKCQVYRDVRPDRLVLGDAALVDWMIRDVRVGTTSLNASTNQIPGRCFAPLSFGNRLRATVTASTSVGITIDCYSNKPVATSSNLCGAFFGPSRFPTA